MKSLFCIFLIFVLPVFWSGWASSYFERSVQLIRVKGVWQDVSSFKIPAAVTPAVNYLHASCINLGSLESK